MRPHPVHTRTQHIGWGLKLDKCSNSRFCLHSVVEAKCVSSGVQIPPPPLVVLVK